MPRSYVCFVLFWTCLGLGQTRVDLRTQTKSVDFSTATTTKPFKSGTVLPSTCSTGEAFFKEDAPAGSNLYACTALNTWTVETGGGGMSSLNGLTGAVTISGGSHSGCSVAGQTITCDVDTGSMLSRVADQAGIDHYLAPSATNCPGGACAYTACPNPALIAYTPGMEFILIPDVASGAGINTINVCTLGPIALQKLVGSSLQGIGANDVVTGSPGPGYKLTGVGSPVTGFVVTPLNFAASGYASVVTTGPGGAQPAPTAQTQRTAFNAKYPMVASDNSGSSRTELDVWNNCDHRRFVCLADEFVGTQGSTTFLGELGWALQSGSSATENPAGTFGVVGAQTGNVSGNGANFVLSPRNSLSGLAAFHATTFDMIWRARIDRATAITAGVGVQDTAGAGLEAASNAMGIDFDTTQSDTNWMCVARATGTSSRAAIGSVPDTNYHTFRLRSTTAGTILCSIDGGSEVSINTNVPTSSLLPAFSVLTRQAATATLYMDFWQMTYAISR